MTVFRYISNWEEIMRNSRSIGRVALAAGSILGVALTMSAVNAGTANAGTYIPVVYQGSDHADLSPGHYYGEVCDMERDGHAVHATFYITSGLKVVTDANGSKAGCSKTGNMHDYIYQVQLCEEWIGPDICEWYD